MKRIKQSFYLICCFLMLHSCNSSNAFKQDQAEKTIREFLTTNTIETSKTFISPQTIQKTGKTNIFTQFNKSVKVYFNNKEGGQELTLLFIFTRTPRNKWFLTSVEEIDGPVQELADWLKTKKKANACSSIKDLYFARIFISCKLLQDKLLKQKNNDPHELFVQNIVGPGTGHIVRIAANII